VVFPEATSLSPGEAIWVTKNAASFNRQFGFLPDLEVVDSLIEVPELLGTWPGFSNSGDEVVLLDRLGQLQDVVVYEDGDIQLPGWSGPSVMPYTVSSVFSEEGQILYRKRDPDSNLPLPDTNRAADWAQDPADAVSGRKVQYPGWDSDKYPRTFKITETTSFEIGIAPDNAFDLITREISEAQQSIQIASHTFRNHALADDLLDALSRGVSVTVLLEGGPAGGIEDQEKLICLSLEEAGGECWFMINDPTRNVHDRYRNYHAKYMIFDNEIVVISTENLSPDSLPSDDKSDGTWGRRGVVLKLTSIPVVEHMRTIWNDDFDPASHLDIIRWSPAHPLYGAPPLGTVPITLTGGTGYSIRFPDPVAYTDTIELELIQSPGNSLVRDDGLLGLLNSTGHGDTILAEELYEPVFWGESNSESESDPNPRLQSMLAAARRGAKVRLLLDEYFDNPTTSRSNWSTCRYVNSIAASEGLDIRCALGNPTGLGIHNKMILIQRNGLGFIHVGSLNGSELSSKGNREVAIQIQSDPAYYLLKEMFQYDWPHTAILPVIYSGYVGPKNHALISEVLYDAYGPDDAEFIEIVNPTGYSIDLSDYSLGDALSQEDYEDVRRFPDNTILGPDETIVVATTATGFWSLFGFYPDFEILDTLSIVPLLIDDPSWGDPGVFIQLGNLGDEVLLRGPDDQIIDAIAYGIGAVPGITSCPLVSGPNVSLERFPYWQDTDDCQQDFRSWPFPNPGDLP
jgi:phosphatidylserine/phosphatidylglycerophosphate/cardiolipin synthase-like enzyme